MRGGSLPAPHRHTAYWSPYPGRYGRIARRGRGMAPEGAGNPRRPRTKPFESWRGPRSRPAGPLAPDLKAGCPRGRTGPNRKKAPSCIHRPDRCSTPPGWAGPNPPL